MMMEKSRLMKEMSSHVPCVYMCLRSGDKSSGYPIKTPNIANWIESGLNRHELERRDFIADSENGLPPLKFAAFLLSLIIRLNELALNADNLANQFGIDVSTLEWLWEFLAQPANAEIEEALHQFWGNIINDATLILKEYHGRGNNSKGNAEGFLKGVYVKEMSDAYINLRSTFLRWVPQDATFPLILLFDEASSLCDISSYDGKHVLNDNCYDQHESERNELSVYQFSCIETSTSYIIVLLKDRGQTLATVVWTIY